MKRNTLLIILLFCLNIWSVYSQDYHQRNWYQIETKQYRLIFPDFLLDTALELADFNDSLYEELQYDIDLPLQQQYPLILYPWTLTSNAYVMPLGRHSQWYTKDSPGFFGDRHWLQILSIHEGRHVLQMQLLQQSTSRWLYYLGGEVFSSISAGVTPQWLFEGDAVYNETLFSNSGRGRSGAFVSPMIINFQETEIPSYSAVQFPSRNRINTNAYNFGFLFNQWLREQYGNEIIDELFTHQAELPLPLLGTSRALKKATGLSLNQNYEDFTEDFVENLPPLDSWSDQIKWISS
jgi:hypothetical protein